MLVGNNYRMPRSAAILAILVLAFCGCSAIDNGDDTVYANYYTDGAWYNTVGVSLGGGTNPKIAFDASGNAAVVWTDTTSVRVNRFLSTGSWTGNPGDWVYGSGGETLSAATAAGSAKAAADANGSLVFVWVDSGKIVSKRYPAGTDWTAWLAASSAVDIDASGACQNPDLSIDPMGRALAVWYSGSSGNTIRAAVFDAP